MSLIKQLAKETAIYGISSILVRFLPFAILTPFYTWYFEKDTFGIFTEAYIWIAFFNVVFIYRMETTFFRFGSQDRQALERAFSTASLSIFTSTIALFTLLLLFRPTLTQIFFHDTDFKTLTTLLISIVAADTLKAIPFARLRLEQRPLRFAIFNTVGILTNIFLVFFFLLGCPYLIEAGWTSLTSFYDPEQPLVYVLLANLLASLTVVALVAPMYTRMKWQFDRALWKRMVRYTAPLVLVGLAGVINQFAGTSMINRLAPGGSERNFDFEGIFGAVAKIAVFMNLYTQAFNYAAEPFFFSNAKRGDALKQYGDIAKAFAIVGAFVFLGIWAYIDIIKYFIATKYHDDLLIAPILLMAYLLLGLYYNFSVWYKLSDQTKYGGYIAIGGAVITLTLNAILIPIPEISYYGPAWTALICYGAMALASYWIGKQKYPIPYELGRIFAHLLVAAIAFGFLFLLDQRFNMGFWGKLAVNTALLIIYGVIIYFWERRFFKRLIKGEKNT